MTSTKAAHYRQLLEDQARQVRQTSRPLEDATRNGTGGDAAGSLSNAPMHLGDMASEMYTQELNATLLENEQNLADEVDDALARLDGGTFGTCEECRTAIPADRLEVVPYARHCVPCAEKFEADGANMNTGRPAGWGSTLEHPNALAGRKRDGESSPTTAPRKPAKAGDRQAVGTPGGGTALGGLAGTNVGGGDPDPEELEGAMGSGDFDTKDEADEAEVGDGYAGPSGGAVGGSPANKRSVGGKTPGVKPR